MCTEARSLVIFLSISSPCFSGQTLCTVTLIAAQMFTRQLFPCKQLVYYSSFDSATKLASSVKPPLSIPRLARFLDYPGFLSSHNFVMNILLVMIKIHSSILFKTIALKSAVKNEFVLLLKSKSSLHMCCN